MIQLNTRSTVKIEDSLVKSLRRVMALQQLTPRRTRIMLSLLLGHDTVHGGKISLSVATK